MAPSATLQASQRQLLSEMISETMGLHFPPERRGDLERGLAGAAEELGFANAGACQNWLLTTPLTKAQVQVLASHLTVGETYFFRERKTFDVLAGSVLPKLISARRSSGKRLRLWSAACCTGEEPYSLAILLDQMIPDLADWNVTILATDINGRFLKKAAAGVYGEWSFRESPAWLKERYFQRTADGRYAILTKIRRRVTFAHLNLAEDVYPALATDTNAMDMILCRNVLMYFTPAQAQKVVRNLRRALVDDSCLVVSPMDGSHALHSGFTPVNFPGAILYQKSAAEEQAPPLVTRVIDNEPMTPRLETPLSLATPTPQALADSFYQQGRYAEAADTLLASPPPNHAQGAKTLSLLTRALANHGKLAEALACCDQWVAADKLEASGHYFRAVVLQELGDNAQARRSLHRAVYLHPDFVLAHFTLGSLARKAGDNAQAIRQFGIVSHLLDNYSPGDLLPESDGMTAGQLTEIIKFISTPEITSLLRSEQKMEYALDSSD